MSGGPVVAGQLDLLDLLVGPARTEREIFTSSGLVFDTEHCRDGDHIVCTGLLDVQDGRMVSQSAPSSPQTGPCRCSCHDVDRASR